MKSALRGNRTIKAKEWEGEREKNHLVYRPKGITSP